MINASSAFKQKLLNDEREYLEKIDLTLSNNTVLHLTNEHIWGRSLSFDDSVGSDSSFTALGSCVVNSLKFTLNNIYDDFSQYDFLNANAIVYIGLDVNGTPDYLKKGVFTVVDPTYNGSTISLVLHDNMAKFDKPYSSSSLTYPASLDTIVRNLCSVCGVTLASSSLNFPRKDYVIQDRPTDDAVTCREVLSWCATIAGCYARCDTDGKLELKWFDVDSFEDPADDLDGGIFDNDSQSVYTSGDMADGGAFNPWETGDAVDGGTLTYFGNLHIIRSLYSHSISVDDVVITQVAIDVKSESDNSNSIITYTSGSSGYTIKVSENQFINESNGQSIANTLGTQLIGLTFRKANITHSSDPTIEAGDCAIVYDRKGNFYKLLVTRTCFKVGAAQTTVCGADTPAKNSAARFSEATKSYVEIRHQLIEQKSEWEEAVEDLEEQIANAGGLYETQEQQTGGGVITYLHNKPILAESDIQIQVSDVGVHVTANGTAQSPTWYGLDVNGVLIAAILNTIGINASWINSGQLVIKDQNNNETFFADTTTGVVRINATQLTINSNPVPSSADLNDAKKIATNYLSYNNNDGITLGYVNTNEKINIDADGMELYDGSNNQIAQFKAVTRLGLANKANLRLDYHSLQLQDTDNNTYVHLSDLRDETGYATISEDATGDGSRTYFYVKYQFSSVVSVTINGTATTAYVADGIHKLISFNTAPANGAAIVITYKVNIAMRAFTFGSRANNNNIGKNSFVNGELCQAEGNNSHAEGYNCKAKGDNSYAGGNGCIANGAESYAYGHGCEVVASNAVAMGDNCKANGYRSIALGYASTADASYSYAFGSNCISKNSNSVTIGNRLSAKQNGQIVMGEYNVEATGTTMFIFGYGYSDASRKNILTMDTSGNMTISGTLTQSSDKRLKHHRAYLSDQQDQVNEFINRLKPAWFEKDEQKHLGFYAQDVQQTDRWQCMVDNDTNGYLTLGYTEILAPLVAYCQNLEQKVETLEQRIARLEQLLNQQ